MPYHIPLYSLLVFLPLFLTLPLFFTWPGSGSPAAECEEAAVDGHPAGGALAGAASAGAGGGAQPPQPG